MPAIRIRRGAGTTTLSNYELGFKTGDKGLYIGVPINGTTYNINIGRNISILDSQSAYDNLTSKDANTIYFIKAGSALADSSYLSTKKSAIESSITTATNSNNTNKSTAESLASSKQDAITGAASSIIGVDLTASRVLISNSSGKIAVSNIGTTSTSELGYLAGVTSAIQTQLNGKMGKTDIVPIANGGTNASTASAARTNLGLKYTQLYSGTFTSGSMTVDITSQDFLVCVGKVRSANATQGWCIPLARVSSTAEKWQFADDVYFFAFNLSKSGNTLTIEQTGTTGGRILRIFGVKVGA